MISTYLSNRAVLSSGARMDPLLPDDFNFSSLARKSSFCGLSALIAGVIWIPPVVYLTGGVQSDRARWLIRTLPILMISVATEFFTMDLVGTVKATILSIKNWRIKRTNEKIQKLISQFPNNDAPVSCSLIEKVPSNFWLQRELGQMNLSQIMALKKNDPVSFFGHLSEYNFHPMLNIRLSGLEQVKKSNDIQNILTLFYADRYQILFLHDPIFFSQFLGLIPQSLITDEVLMRAVMGYFQGYLAGYFQGDFNKEECGLIFRWIRRGNTFFQAIQKIRPPDFIFNLKGTRIEASKIILTNRSPVFEKMFSSGMREQFEEEITVNEYDPEIFRLFIQLLMDETQEIPPEFSMDIYKMAHCYSVYDLLRQCEQILCAHSAMYSLDEKLNFLLLFPDCHKFKVLVLEESYTYVRSAPIQDIEESDNLKVIFALLKFDDCVDYLTRLDEVFYKVECLLSPPHPFKIESKSSGAVKKSHKTLLASKT